MYKTLLKLLLYEVVEKLARFEQLLHHEALASDTTPAVLFDRLKLQAQEVKQGLFSDKSQFLALFSDKPLKDAAVLSQISQRIYEAYGALSRLTQVILPYVEGHVLPETNIFLKDVLSELAQELGLPPAGVKPVVYFHPEGVPPQESVLSLSDLCVEPLSILQKANPLGWVSLTRTLSQQIFYARPEFDDLRQRATGTLAQVEFFKSLACHLLSLRLVGPAYYYATVTEALLQQDHVFLSVLEPALFQGVHHFNFTDKSLVILHEATEKSQEFFPNRNPSAKTATEDSLGELLRAVERLIPERVAFTDKQFEKSLQLQDRLAQETLLSGANTCSPEAIREALDKKLSGGEVLPGEVLPIYELLTMVTETPNSPREIVNAGWVHKLERAPVWLYNTLNFNDEEGFSRLTDLVVRQDHLLVKSIETSEVHRVLLCGV